MTAAYFAPLVTLPVIIKAAGEYITRAGERVSVDSTSTRHDFGCLGFYHDAMNTPERWHKSGRILASSETQNDIVRPA